MRTAAPGEWVDTGTGLADIDFDEYSLRVSTDRYTARDIAERERTQIWMRVWQVAGRVDEVPDVGDWKEYRILDQSYVIVRGGDGELRGFVNACRHRGNKLCAGGSGNCGSAGRFVCPYHLWSYDLDGRLLRVSRPDLVGPIDKEEHGLLAVSVECFAGFIFLNPDPDAAPLAEYLGDVANLLAPYHLEEMVPVLNVRERVDCNWKVVVDAFSEGYHVDAIHPELLRVLAIDASKERFGFFGDHFVVAVPFEVANVEGFGPEQQVEGIRELPGTFPGVAAVLPTFDALIDGYRDGDGTLRLPDGVTPRTVLQQATREAWTRKGLDVSGLTDAQMSDNHAWLLFPNFFATIRAGEATVILALPHPDGDPNRCIWHVLGYMWLPPEEREAARVGLTEVEEAGTYEYFLALQQDYEQMPRQQAGLRNTRLEYQSLARHEVRIAHFHRSIDRYLDAGDARMTNNEATNHIGALTATVLEYDRIISDLVKAAKEPGFSRASWAPLEELIAVDDFERVGILRETMDWEQYADFLTKWAASKGFSTTVRRINEVPPLVYYEVEEHHFMGDEITIINSMNVFEFDDAGKICHLDVYLQGQLYAPGRLPDYAVRE